MSKEGVRALLLARSLTELYHNQAASKASLSIALFSRCALWRRRGCSVLPSIGSIETKTDGVKRLGLRAQVFLTFCF